MGRRRKIGKGKRRKGKYWLPEVKYQLKDFFEFNIIQDEVDTPVAISVKIVDYHQDVVPEQEIRPESREDRY